MNNFINKNVNRKIIILILLVMSLNFILPTISQASLLDELGGTLFLPISQFLRFVGDLVIKGVQEIFTGDPIIEDGGSYCIKYSPGIIFSNKIAALDVNFFKPGTYTKSTGEIEKKHIDTKQFEGKNYQTPNTSASNWEYNTSQQIKTFLNENGIKYSEDITIEKVEDIGDTERITVDLNGGNPKPGEVYYPDNVDVYSHVNKYKCSWRDSEYLYELEYLVVTTFLIDGLTYVNDISISGIGSYKFVEGKLQGQAGTFNIKLNKYTENPVTVNVESSATTLRPIVATWYKALRAIALVGLLSILVYIGIRILISSTGQEKAKYKKMIGNWLAAICILFVLQYIMIFTLEITESVTKILSVNIVGEEGQDVLMSDIRSQLDGGDEIFTEVFPELLMYLTLVIYTVMFTIQYIKRLIYMAFFTIIAPLIALTYPLDKIKDGQAQAFTIWIREYIFNALLQPMHLLLYYIFISSAKELVDSNWIYAVIAIGFLLPAEKFFRKMFGFENASSANPVAAAAGGALVMNAINKMGHIGGAKQGGNSGGSGNSGQEGSAPRYVSGPNDLASSSEVQTTQGAPSGSGGQSSPGGSPNGPQSYNAPTYGQTINSGSQPGGRSFRNGARTLAGHYFNASNGKKLAKGAGRLLRKGAVGLAGAATLGTVGLAAGIATGDASKAFSYGLTGAGAGFMGANALGDKAVAFEKKNREIFKEGALGTEEYNTRGSIQELTNDNDFNRVCKNLGVTKKADKEALIRQFRNNGITSSNDIKKAMNLRASTGASQNEIIAAQKIRQQATQYGMKRKDIEDSLRGKGITGSDLNKAMNLIDRL